MDTAGPAFRFMGRKPRIRRDGEDGSADGPAGAGIREISCFYWAMGRKPRIRRAARRWIGGWPGGSPIAKDTII